MVCRLDFYLALLFWRLLLFWAFGVRNIIVLIAFMIALIVCVLMVTVINVMGFAYINFRWTWANLSYSCFLNFILLKLLYKYPPQFLFLIISLSTVKLKRCPLKSWKIQIGHSKLSLFLSNLRTHYSLLFQKWKKLLQTHNIYIYINYQSYIF